MQSIIALGTVDMRFSGSERWGTGEWSGSGSEGGEGMRVLMLLPARCHPGLLPMSEAATEYTAFLLLAYYNYHLL